MSDGGLRVAVVGAGPAGLFAVGALVAGGDAVTVDLIDRLPTPFGLVRAGVAPDHQNIKVVARALDRAARSPQVRFYGGVEVDRDVTVEDLLRSYDQVLLAHGAEDARSLDILGESLPGSLSATAFVGWYNGHPDHQGHRVDLNGRTAVVIGAGNVALDVARMLLKAPSSLHPTDIASPALESLRHSSLREVVIVARRGPLDAAFTPAELQELMELPDVDAVVDPAQIADDLARAPLVPDKQLRRNMELFAAASAHRPLSRRRVRWVFGRAPTALLGDGQVRAVEFAVQRLERRDGETVATDSGARERIDADLVVRAVGYRGRPLGGVPCDPNTGRTLHLGGRVIHRDGSVVPGLYVAGWAKRGPRGVIGTNRADAKETVTAMLADRALRRGDGQPVAALGQATSWEDWDRLDAWERSRGEAAGRVREKLLSMAAMAEVLRGGV